ncbi:hypothetical protein BDK51DRAFT_29365 [Blyttiomyces helicus]|uniref:Uncharacterized protein n=1 Tax=Blyttiomyces helicus TaxID=388810 RepID=A0A4P9WQM6_9FUNG|nr:hypothetical protein BDK51DRAFT_29365 [Blyttiomyces helicus]|eukprot:RKO94483.1 hypothetical protein BDK51DRAFT_29365 [Blyttiomyces helicus]
MIVMVVEVLPYSAVDDAITLSRVMLKFGPMSPDGVIFLREDRVGSKGVGIALRNGSEVAVRAKSRRPQYLGANGVEGCAFESETEPCGVRMALSVRDRGHLNCLNVRPIERSGQIGSDELCSSDNGIREVDNIPDSIPKLVCAQSNAALGCMLSAAVGDAAGSTMGFRHDKFNQFYGAGCSESKKGGTTDDTELQICLANALKMGPETVAEYARQDCRLPHPNIATQEANAAYCVAAAPLIQNLGDAKVLVTETRLLETLETFPLPQLRQISAIVFDGIQVGSRFVSGTGLWFRPEEFWFKEPDNGTAVGLQATWGTTFGYTLGRGAPTDNFSGRAMLFLTVPSTSMLNIASTSDDAITVVGGDTIDRLVVANGFSVGGETISITDATVTFNNHLTVQNGFYLYGNDGFQVLLSNDIATGSNFYLSSSFAQSVKVAAVVTVAGNLGANVGSVMRGSISMSGYSIINLVQFKKPMRLRNKMLKMLPVDVCKICRNCSDRPNKPQLDVAIICNG